MLHTRHQKNTWTNTKTSSVQSHNMAGSSIQPCNQTTLLFQFIMSNSNGFTILTSYAMFQVNINATHVAFRSLAPSFEPGRVCRLGTLFYLAREGVHVPSVSRQIRENCGSILLRRSTSVLLNLSSINPIKLSLKSMMLPRFLTGVNGPDARTTCKNRFVLKWHVQQNL